MKTTFTKESIEQKLKVSFQNDTVTLSDIFECEDIDFASRLYFILNCTCLEQEELSPILVDLTEKICPIFDSIYPNDKRIRDCVKITRKYLARETSKPNLINASKLAYEAYRSIPIGGDWYATAVALAVWHVSQYILKDGSAAIFGIWVSQVSSALTHTDAKYRTKVDEYLKDLING